VRDAALRPLLLLVWGWFALVLASLLQTEVTTGIVMGGGRLMLPRRRPSPSPWRLA